MAFQTVFKRYELKFFVTEQQKEKILSAAKGLVVPDKYGRTTIRNVYFDTPTFRIIRRSVERPDYKEKLRVRSYAAASFDSTVFIELKRKCDGIVYKRRVPLTQKEALDWLSGQKAPHMDTQMVSETEYFIKYYGKLIPTVFLSYDREAYYSADDPSLRITFDRNVLCRTYDLSLEKEPKGEPILPRGKILMEIKCAGAIPLWLTRVLSEQKIYKTSFSKYGRAYETLIFPKITKEKNYA